MGSANKSTSEYYVNSGKNSNRENPKSGLQDTNPQTHSNDGGVKKGLDVENNSSREDLIDREQTRRPRDNA